MPVRPNSQWPGWATMISPGWCVTIRVVLGAGYMWAAGAPSHYIPLNAAALVVGAITAWAGRRLLLAVPFSAGAWTVVVGLLLVWTALDGIYIDGASRWIRIGGLSLQPSLILLPAVMVVYAGDWSWLSTLGFLIASAGIAMQPDRAMAGALAAGLVTLWMYRRELPVAIAASCAVAALVVTLVQADTVPPVEFVEQVVQSAFGFHWSAGIAVVAGLLTMLAPGGEAVGSSGNERAEVAVFATTWLAVIVASLLGNYPTPLVGYGSSAILGYCLSAAAISDRRTIYSRAA